MKTFNDLPVDVVKYNIINKLVYNIYNTTTNNKVRFIQDNFDFCLITGDLSYKTSNKNQNFILSHLKNIYKLRSINNELSCLVDNPFNLNAIEKDLIAKNYIRNKGLFSDENSYTENILYIKILDKLTLASKDPTIIIKDIIDSYKDEVRLNMKHVLNEIITEHEPLKYTTSNDTCKICSKDLPLYWPNARYNWNRALKDKFEPRALLKRCCSKKCLKKIKNDINLCVYCYGGCGHIFDYNNTIETIFFTYRNARIVDEEHIELGEIHHILETYYPTDIFCSRRCKFLFDKRASIIIDSNVFEVIEFENNEFADIYHSKNIVDVLKTYPCIACKDGIINPIPRINIIY